MAEVRSRATRSRLRIATAAGARVHLRAADHPGRHLRVQPERDVRPGRRRASRSTGSARRSRTRRSAGPFLTSFVVALGATVIALVLGTLASLAVAAIRVLRSRDDLVPPRPADRAAGRRDRHGPAHDLRHDRVSPLGLFAIIVGHATFCVVLVYNNVIARLRRSAAVARGGVGRPRGGHVRRRSAASPCRRCGPRSWPAALLAFALSFDEIIVTIFTAGAGTQDAADLDLPDASGWPTRSRS